MNYKPVMGPVVCPPPEHDAELLRINKELAAKMKLEYPQLQGPMPCFERGPGYQLMAREQRRNHK